MEMVIKKFEELEVNELYEILRLRSEIFVVEQNCVYQDLDNKDLKSTHFYIKDNHEIICYLRAIPKGISYDMASIGRVVSKYRRKGNTIKLVKAAINYIFDNFDSQEIVISSQVQASGFYEKCGFVKFGKSYLEDDIPHIQMRINKNNHNK